MELLSCALLTIADAPAAARPAVEAAIAATLRSAPPLALGAAFATTPDPRGSHSFAPSVWDAAFCRWEIQGRWPRRIACTQPLYATPAELRLLDDALADLAHAMDFRCELSFLDAAAA